jgi:hypothetical protein
MTQAEGVVRSLLKLVKLQPEYRLRYAEIALHRCSRSELAMARRVFDLDRRATLEELAIAVLEKIESEQTSD